MPVFTKDTVKTEQSDGENHPCGAFRAMLFSDSGGLTQFGAFEEILPPGSWSSIKHWHAVEDEMVYVLRGQVTLHEGDATTVLGPGDVATFKAGDPVGHCLENRSDAEVSYLVIGTRSPADVVTCPDHDRVLHFDRAAETRRWTDHSGAPADSAYSVG